MNRFPFLGCLILALGGLSMAANQQPASPTTDDRLLPFTVEWPSRGEFPADVSFLLPAPAGKDGFVAAKDGHLVRPDGSRFRIWGINATARTTVPSKEDAPVLAANLARRGLNCVRFHFLDRLAPAGLVDATRNDTRALDPAQLDKLDFFIAELKQRGIYADLNLNVARSYKPGDGVRDHELLGFGKSVTYFDERLIELQKEYARQLLTHVNPYTGKAYREEPAVAVVEFVNENSLIEAWIDGRIKGQQTQKTGGTWVDIPPSYGEALTAKYNEWLASAATPEVLARLRAAAGVAAHALVPRLQPSEFKQASQERFRLEASFYMETEKRFFRMMSAYLRDELAVKSLLIGNSDHGHGHSGYPIVDSTSLLDVVDSHVYWQHPHYLTNEQGKTIGFDIGNTPMVDDPLRSSVVQLSRTAVAGKPFTVSEVNHPFPNEFACEGIPVLAAYAALQDWDGVFWYTLAHGDVLAEEPVQHGHFDFSQDPVKMSQLPAGALTFLRGDVRSAQRTVTRSYSREQVVDSLLLTWKDAPYFTPGFPLALPLQHAVRTASFNGPPTSPFASISQSSPLVSDTGELTWRFGEKRTGLVSVDTPLSQSLVGHCQSTGAATSNLGASVTLPFCALTLSSLDSKPIAESGRLLLTATARTANTGMVWNEKRTSLANWGKAPTVIEPVAGRIVLKDLRGARSVTAQALDGAGRPVGTPLSAKPDGQAWTLSLGQPVTTWYAVSVER